ncbi:MAG: thioesterase family protein [Gammaproteobacteria bacterium]|nr:thioesterase family protein [Gammaproteobacteria bacterium]
MTRPSNMDFEYRFTVAMSSVDAAGVMFFPELLRHAHDAYEAYMKFLGHELCVVLAQEQYVLPIRRAEADYLQPMRLGTEFVVRPAISRIGETSFAVVARFVGGNEELYARTETIHVCVDKGTGRPMRLPEKLRDSLPREPEAQA